MFFIDVVMVDNDFFRFDRCFVWVFIVGVFLNIDVVDGLM